MRCSTVFQLLDCGRKGNIRESRWMSAFVVGGGDRLHPVNRTSQCISAS